MNNNSSNNNKNSSLPDELIIVTGAAGFIGSCMVEFLNQHSEENLILVDDFGVEEKRKNWEGKNFQCIVERYNLMDWLQQNQPKIRFFIHLGARTDTTEFDYSIHQELNVDYSQEVWNYCCSHRVPLIYASSAATYGSGDKGYDDKMTNVEELEPLNPYGVSKNQFDIWALRQQVQPPFWAGLKFFNVYGPNEYHKGRMASVIFHSFNQILKEGEVKLFKSHREDFEDGKQLRDFIYVKDVVKTILWMMEQFLTTDKITRESALKSGIYNLGTGNARTFEDLVKATFAGLEKSPKIKYIDMPLDIRDKYQYYTEAKMEKLIAAGYPYSFTTLEDGVSDYVKNYLSQKNYY